MSNKLKKIFILAAFPFLCPFHLKAIDFRTTKAIFEKTMENEWETLCLPFPVTVNLNKEYTLYRVSSFEDGCCTLEPYAQNDILDAGTPCIIQKHGNRHLKISQDSTSVTPTVNKDLLNDSFHFLGSYTDKEINGNNVYYINNNFIHKQPNTKPTTIIPFTAWFVFASDENLSDFYSFMDEESATIFRISPVNKEEKIFDIRGNRLSSLQKGINIIVTNKGTRKVIVK